MTRIAVAFMVAAAMAAAAVWWLRAPEQSAPPPEAQRVPARAQAPPSTLPAVPTESPGARKLTELRALSETVRNSTFVIAIRAAGFVCEDVIGAEQADPDAPAWRARCRDLRAYILRVDDAGALAIEPTVPYWDSVVVPVSGPQGGPPERLSPPDLLQPREPQR